MNKYNLEFKWIVKRHLSLVITSNIKNAEELIVMSNELYENYTIEHDHISFYFFNEREYAVDYVYKRFVLSDFTVKTIENSNCVGYLENNELFGLFHVPKLIKVYNTPGDQMTSV